MIEIFFNSILYIFLFFTLYLEVFFLITFFEERLKLAVKSTTEKLPYYPSVTIIVPCWNEETTVSKTLDSLLALRYPKNKLEIFVINDGSTDKTWEVVQKFKNNPQVKLFHKENGGKHTAVNFGIKNSTSELVGCLDADSFVDEYALHEIASAFNDDPHMMAATPMLIVHEPKTILQKMQKTEYHTGAFLKRMLSPLDAIAVTPGPFSIFRSEVYKKIGLYFIGSFIADDAAKKVNPMGLFAKILLKSRVCKTIFITYHELPILLLKRPRPRILRGH